MSTSIQTLILFLCACGILLYLAALIKETKKVHKKLEEILDALTVKRGE